MNTQPKATNPILKLHPKQSEAKKVSVDDGFIQIPRRLFLKLSKFGFTQHQQAVINAVIIKCLGFHKEIDWISNPQIVELTSIGYGNKASTAKQELIRMNVLVQKGNFIGFNMNLDEWEKDDLPKQSNIYRNGKNKFTKTVNDDLPKQSNTKETITKEKINITPLPPTGKSAIADEQAVEKNKKSAKPKLEYQAIMDLYNQANEDTGGRLPFVESLSDKRKRAMNKFWDCLKNKTLDGVGNYFEAFFENLTPHHIGKNDRGWKASFDFAIREDIVIRVREGAL